MTAKTPLPDDPCVPVRTMLRPSTFRQLAGHAALRGMTVAEIVSKLADASLKPVEFPKPRVATPSGMQVFTEKGKKRHKKHVRLGTAQRAEVRRLLAEGAAPAALAELFEVSRSTIANIEKEGSA